MSESAVFKKNQNKRFEHGYVWLHDTASVFDVATPLNVLHVKLQKKMKFIDIIL